MTPRRMELALAKQRLQMQSAAQREDIAVAAAGLVPLFVAGEAVRTGGIWLRQNPEWLAGAAVALAVARPRRILRWTGRIMMAARAWRRLRSWQPELFGRSAT